MTNKELKKLINDHTDITEPLGFCQVVLYVDLIRAEWMGFDVENLPDTDEFRVELVDMG